jgi:hypothetical protein
VMAVEVVVVVAVNEGRASRRGHGDSSGGWEGGGGGAGGRGVGGGWQLPRRFFLEWPQVRPQSTPAAAAKAPTHTKKKKKKRPPPIPATNPGLVQVKAAWNTQSGQTTGGPAQPALNVHSPHVTHPRG